MPDDPIPDTPPPATPVVAVEIPPALPAGRGVTCEFCGCKLDREGNVLRRGDAARIYIEMEERNKLQAKEISELKEKLAAIQAEVHPSRSKGTLRFG